ncbi:MAG: EpsG family protein, partial [Romboutsia sp.]|uniref:EpsG family protein n=1 Tax=Romboutsia sp. TaxID=1965302 RepID=UPI003F318BDF
MNIHLVTSIGLVSSYIISKINNKNKKIIETFLFVIFGILLTVISGIRYKVGTDYHTYTEVFQVFGQDAVEWFKPEAGFQYLMNLIHKISNNPQMFFMITSIIVNFAILYFIKKNSKDIMMSLYLYIATFIYYGTMNGVRQYIASGILLFGFKLVKERKLKKYIIVVLIASMFHTSAFIMIPIYFIVNKKIQSVGNLIFIGVISIGFIFYQKFIDIVFLIFKDSKYGYYGDIMRNTANGANILRILVWLTPIIIIFLYRRKIDFNDIEVRIIINMCFYGLLFMILAYRHVLFARFCMYFDIYYLLLIPYILKLFDKKIKRILIYLIIVLYFIYSYLLLLRGESHIYP